MYIHICLYVSKYIHKRTRGALCSREDLESSSSELAGREAEAASRSHEAAAHQHALLDHGIILHGIVYNSIMLEILHYSMI